MLHHHPLHAPRGAALSVAALAFLAITATGTVAAADDTIKTPGDHPKYSVEIEPHLTLGWDNVYASSGFGLGGRIGIPIVQNGFIPTLNNSVAINFGLEFLHYSGCYYRSTATCGANYLFFPVALQWNFFVARQWSVFGEPGFFLFKGFFDECKGKLACADAETFGWRPAFSVGGRYHFSEHMALTMRVGYPAFSIGLSFM